LGWAKKKKMTGEWGGGCVEGEEGGRGGVSCTTRYRGGQSKEQGRGGWRKKGSVGKMMSRDQDAKNLSWGQKIKKDGLVRGGKEWGGLKRGKMKQRQRDHPCLWGGGRGGVQQILLVEKKKVEYGAKRNQGTKQTVNNDLLLNTAWGKRQQGGGKDFRKRSKFEDTLRGMLGGKKKLIFNFPWKRK